jgi:hypothetical protein
VASLKELHQLREKIADLKASIEREKNRGLTKSEIADLIESRVNAWGQGLYDSGYVGINAAHHALDQGMLIRAAVETGSAPEDRLIAVLAWLFPDQMKAKLTEAAMPYADDGKAKLDVRKLEQDCYDLELAEERLYCELEESGINPGPRRPDCDPLIVIGDFTHE